jgi:hypothetical protein
MHAATMDQQSGQSFHFLKRQQTRFVNEDRVDFWHAVEAADVAAIGHAQPNTGVEPTKAVDQADRVGRRSHIEIILGMDCETESPKIKVRGLGTFRRRTRRSSSTS